MSRPYAEKIKNPEWAARERARWAEAKRKARQKSRPCPAPLKECPAPVTPEITPDVPPLEDPLARIHRQYREECIALGYDVDGNRRVVYERIADKLADPNLRLTPPRTDLKGDPEDQGPSKKK